MFYRIREIEEISADYARKLDKAGITTTEHLLAKGSDARSRGQLALETGVAEKYLTRWVALADLMRIKGVGSQYGELLMAVGVDSTDKLQTMKPQELLRKMEEYKKTKKLVGGVPKLAEVELWLNELHAPAFAHVK
jgi:predicted flap endonuclease-1-like 5' DNA nuclease